MNHTPWGSPWHEWATLYKEVNLIWRRCISQKEPFSKFSKVDIINLPWMKLNTIGKAFVWMNHLPYKETWAPQRRGRSKFSKFDIICLLWMKLNTIEKASICMNHSGEGKHEHFGKKVNPKRDNLQVFKVDIISLPLMKINHPQYRESYSKFSRLSS